MRQKRLDQFGLIGNGRAQALIGLDGAAEWLRVHGTDDPLLEAFQSGPSGGYFSVRPPGQVQSDWDAAQEYLSETNLLLTRVRTDFGEAEITDFIPMSDPADGPLCLMRRIRGRQGDIRLECELRPREISGQSRAQWQVYNSHACGFARPGQTLTLLSSHALYWHEQRTTFAVQENETVWFALYWTPVPAAALEADACEQMLESTRQGWREWLNTTPLALLTAGEQVRDSLSRVLLTIGALFNRSNGQMMESLPCQLTQSAAERQSAGNCTPCGSLSSIYELLYRTGHEDMAELWLARCEYALGLGVSAAAITAPAMEQLGTDPSAPETEACAISNPTVFAAYVEAHFTRARLSGDIETNYWRRLSPIIDFAAINWSEATPPPDDSKGVPHHYTLSKLMWWLVLDRGIQIAERFGLAGEIDNWKSEREDLREDIISRGYNNTTGTFTKHYDSTDIDASLSAIPVIGFLSVEDPRVRRTLSAIEKDLVQDNLLVRNFVAASPRDERPVRVDYACWYAQTLIMQSRLDQAAFGLRQLQLLGSRLGLLSTAFDSRYGRLLGDFPAVGSMAEFGISLLRFVEARIKQQPAADQPKRRGFSWLFRSAGLRPPMLEHNPATDRPDTALQVSLHELRHEFYDAHYQRMEYHRIRGTRSYQRFLAAIDELQDFDPAVLSKNEEKRGFWLNVFNAFVIHGIVELGLSRSVKDVPLFYDRVQHCIGGHQFTPMDIEHGILRGNAPQPGRRRNRFSQRDNRRLLAVSQTDPRIHFALYGGNRGASYFDVYNSERDDTLLDQAARSFVKMTSHADLKRNVLVLSQKLDWYRDDFPEGQAAFLQYLSSYFDDSEVSQWLAEQGRRIRVTFREYDWTLNS